MGRKITALVVQKRNPQRINVFLDGEFAFGLSRFAAAWLQVGQELEPGKIEALLEADAQEVAYQRALHFVSYRPRSEAEIRQNLRQHEVLENVVVAVIERLRAAGLVDDLQFAQNWVENRTAFRPRGRRALAAELRQKGLPDPVIEQAIGELDEEMLAYEAAIKQSRKYQGLARPEFRQKMGAFLARRGFGYGAAAAAIERAWAEIQA
jgi:regulatory protein